MVTSLTPHKIYGRGYSMVHKSALSLTFRLVPVDLLIAPEGWKYILFSTLGKKWVQVTYMDPLYAN